MIKRIVLITFKCICFTAIYDSLTLNFLTLIVIKKSVNPTRMSVSFQRNKIVEPLSIMPFMMIINQREGMIILKYCKGSGIFSIGNIKPESRIVGNIKTNIESIIAICCVWLTVEINIPKDKDMKINNIVSRSRKIRLPCTGIPSTKNEIRRITQALTHERIT
jgi:hypothetical protein